MAYDRNASKIRFKHYCTTEKHCNYFTIKRYLKSENQVFGFSFLCF